MKNEGDTGQSDFCHLVVGAREDTERSNKRIKFFLSSEAMPCTHASLQKEIRNKYMYITACITVEFNWFRVN